MAHRRWPLKKNIRPLLLTAAALLIILVLVVPIVIDSPFRPRIDSFIGNTVPVQRLYLTLFRNSGICQPLEAFRGLDEMRGVSTLSSADAGRYVMAGRTGSGLQIWNSILGPIAFPRHAGEWSTRIVLAQMELGAYPGLQVQPGDVAVDAGGYVGDWAKYAVAAGASKVIVFEPAQEQLECIRLNLQEELASQRVILVPKGLWDREERLYLSRSIKNPSANSVSADPPAEGESIELTTLDKALEDLGIDKLNVLKMDIEGAEERALLGAMNTLQSHRPIIAVATEHTDNPIRNNLKVIRAVYSVAPFYRPRCGSCTVRNGTVIPETIYFSPR